MGASSTEFDAEYGADQIQILEGLEVPGSETRESLTDKMLCG